MDRITPIPRDLIRHLEWVPGQETQEKKTRRKTRKVKPKQEKQGQVILPEKLSKYIQVGIDGLHGNPVVISPFELEGYNNKTYPETHHKLLRNGLYMPTPHIFMKHFTNVVNAFKWKRKLSYADGSEVPSALVEEMYKHLTTNYKDVYGEDTHGVWTWLNAKYEQRGGEWYVETIVGSSGSKKKPGFITSGMKLDEFLEDNCFVDLAFTDQGLPRADAKSKNEKYKPGKNVYFYHPRNGYVAWFNADSDWAGLYCDWDPDYRYASLGVFGCAEGTHEKIKEKK